MRDLPTGTVTFLFTDIEGSTRLLDELGARYAEVLSEHHRLMRGAFEPRGGVEVDTAGDAFFVVFERPADAVAAAHAAQEALAPTGLKVRMGIHTGDVLLGETGGETDRAANLWQAIARYEEERGVSLLAHERERYERRLVGLDPTDALPVDLEQAVDDVLAAARVAMAKSPARAALD